MLRNVKNELLQALKDCLDPSCKDIEAKYRIGELDSNGIDYDLVCIIRNKSLLYYGALV